MPLLELDSPQMYRGHKSRHSAIFFNKIHGRWADPQGDFGTMYLGETHFCSFAEAFIQGASNRFASQSLLAASCLCPVLTDRPLVLVDLTTGPNLMQIGADNRVCDGPHDVSQRWARALWSHPQQPDGLYYRSRNAPEFFSIALFDRVQPALREDCSRNLLADPASSSRLLDYFRCALLP
ncbi:RES family NAD+ phosphorylase [soil metagenome]